MKVLVINCGSSSLKYQLIDMDGEKVLCKGLCERIGMESSMITHEANGHKADYAHSKGLKYEFFSNQEVILCWFDSKQHNITS